jgi:chromosome partitioning protein
LTRIQKNTSLQETRSKLDFPVNASFSDMHVTLTDLANLAKHAESTLLSVRDQMLQPFPRKVAPAHPIASIATLCGIDQEQLRNLLRREGMPGKIVDEKTKKVRYSLEAVQEIVRQCGNIPPRPAGKDGATIVCVNFKGGSTKTTTSINLAQGLTLRGRKVLFIDMDPQASATTLFGLMPPLEVQEEDTVSCVTWREEAPADLSGQIQPTYWNNLDMIPATPRLYDAEWNLVSLVSKAESKWWGLLKDRLAPLKKDYDYIIIDTQPSLSLMSAIGMHAADAMIMPLPPEALDFASSVSFWQMANEVMGFIAQQGGGEKAFAFLSVLIQRADKSLPSSIVRQFIRECYGKYLMGAEVPYSKVSSTLALEFKTVFDAPDYDGSKEAYLRLRQAYEAVVQEIDEKTMTTIWGIK